MKLFERSWTFVTTVAIVRCARYVDPCNRSGQCNYSPDPDYNELSPSETNCSLYDSCRLGGVWATFSCNATHRWFDIVVLECEPLTTARCQPQCWTNASTSAPDSIDSTSLDSSTTPTPSGSVDIALIVGLTVGLGVPIIAAGVIAIILAKDDRFRDWCRNKIERCCHNNGNNEQDGSAAAQQTADADNNEQDGSAAAQQTADVDNNEQDGSAAAQQTADVDSTKPKESSAAQQAKQGGNGMTPAESM